MTPDDSKTGGKKKRKALIIAMDGPAGVGKSTIGHLVAKDLGYHFINTGEMYRALTWRALEDKLNLEDQDVILALAERIEWDFRPTDEGTTLKTFIDGQGVTTQIRDEKVSKNSSVIAANPGVRKFMCKLQRKLGQDGGIVMEGRDITTHVFPDADFKIYLDASVDERADRRYRQLKAQGHDADRQKIKEAILTRDLNDLKRKINPLTQAADAIVIDSTSMSMHEVAGRILKTIRNGH